MVLGMVNGSGCGDFFARRDAMNSSRLVELQAVKHPSGSAGLSVNSTGSHDGVASEDSEIFSDIVLGYINWMLNEEDINEKLDIFQGHPALEATEKRFYEVLAAKYPPSLDQPPLYYKHSPESPDDSVYGNSDSSSSSSSGAGIFEFSAPQSYNVSVGYSSHSSFSSTNSIHSVPEGMEEPMPLFNELPEWQFIRGVEEARKLLPSEDKLVIDLEANAFSLPRESEEGNGLFEAKVEREERECSVHGSRGRKNRHGDDLDVEEGRSNKQSAVDYSEETLRSEMFDLVLLCQCKSGQSALPLQGVIQNEASRSQKNGHSKGSGGGKDRGKGRGRMQTKSETVDFNTLLTHCAQAVAIDDRHGANELLKQIRQHASPFGDGTQRLALCFADGLEARLAGTGSETYHSLVAKPVTAAEILKAYQLYMATCPFKRVAHFFSCQMILNTIENASAVHILDFGIYFGFQWPSFLQRLVARPGGPPKLRITGIEVPQPGFRPAERIEETGRRLAEYARFFNVPFEYHAIAAKWETIRIEDLKIDKDEVLVVNSLFRFNHLADESVAVNCPRDMVLNMIKKLNPAIFIQGIVNGSYGAPFFVTRFRQALFHFSALSDMLEATTAREDPQRMMIERNMFGRSALNVIACEGSDRVERPETYKQWKVRNLRAGFVQLPLDRDIMKKARDKVKACYHKEFVIDEDNQWLLQGWKGRIIYALSAWKPNKL